MSWVKLHRKFLKWQWYDDVNTKTVFLHLLITANYEENKWRGIVIKRGQALVGSVNLASEVGLTRQQVRTALSKLKTTNEITIETTSQYSIITLVKYEEYQKIDEEITNEQPGYQPTSNQQVTNEQPTSNQRITTLKEEKEIKERKEREREGALPDFENLKFEGKFLEFANSSGLSGESGVKCWQKWKLKRAGSPPDEPFEDWCIWALNERKPLSTGANDGEKALQGEELRIQHLGSAAWRRKGKMSLNPEQARMLDDYEKINGIVWWDNLRQYKQGKPPN